MVSLCHPDWPVAFTFASGDDLDIRMTPSSIHVHELYYMYVVLLWKANGLTSGYFYVYLRA